MSDSIEQDMEHALHRHSRASSAATLLAAVAAIGASDHPARQLATGVPETPWLAIARKRSELHRIAAAEAKRERRKAKARP